MSWQSAATMSASFSAGLMRRAAAGQADEAECRVRHVHHVEEVVVRHRAVVRAHLQRYY